MFFTSCHNMKIYLKWASLFLCDIVLLCVAYPLAPLLSLFTADGWPAWGAWFWTFDNSPQGDRGFIRERAPFTPAVTPLQRYANRVAWLWRNPLYGFQKAACVDYQPSYVVNHIGNPDISDKYKVAGWYFAECRDSKGDLVAFEFYMVKPWLPGRCIRVRVGWKIMTDKFSIKGFAPFVDTINPIDGYGG